MYIKEIILDGFKSYANRTVIKGFDPNFNAITGLNGSGKSNILDAICFVLGISQLQHVRVNSLQELVYKQGQARVTKASVSIVFENSDKAESPPGYENCEEVVVTRQIIIGGRNKYLINGHSAQVNRVQSFFQSVHLNINNPHFLIMQGKITKVLGMKPLEILSMVEEAAGTKMYEIKRNSAQKVIQRKGNKLKEIDRTLEEEITPLLDKLKKQKIHYLTWSSNNTEIERLKRFRVAFSYFVCSLAAGKQRATKEKMQRDLEALDLRLQELTADIKGIAIELDDLSARKSDLEMGELETHNKEFVEISKRITKENAVCENKKAILEEEVKNLEQSIKSIEMIKKNLTDSKTKYAEDLSKYQSVKQKSNKLSAEAASLQGRQLGFSIQGGEEGSKGSLTAQLMDNQRTITELDSEKKKRQFKLKEVLKTIARVEADFGRFRAENDEIKAEIEQKREEIGHLRAELTQFDSLEERNSEAKQKLSQIDQKLHELETRKQRLNAPVFRYRPTRDFDKSKVHGFVANLIEVKDPAHTEAIEITAGGKLKNVVIETQRVGKELLKFGKIEQRVTMIPLDKVKPKTLSPEVLQAAKRVAQREDVFLALDCIKFGEKFRRAMEFVFGATVVCPDLQSAKRVAYGLKTRVRTVTLSGDLFEPQGTLTGGYRSRKFSLLAVLREGQRAEEMIRAQIENKRQLSAKAGAFQSSLRAFHQKKQSVSMKEHELKTLLRRFENSQGGMLRREKEKLETEREEQRGKIGRISSEIKDIEKTNEELEGASSGTKSEKSIESKLRELKRQLAGIDEEVAVWSQKVEYNEMEQRNFDAELEKNTALAEAAENSLEQLRGDLRAIAQSIEELEEERAKQKAGAAKALKEIKAIEEDVRVRDEKTATLEKEKDHKGIEAKKLQNELARFEKSHKEASDNMRALEKENKWISEEKKLFGKASTDYDFEAVKPDFVVARLKNLSEQQNELSSRINKNVLVMFDKAEQDYNNLVKKRKIVLEDKKKIEKVIAELDRKKDEVLNRTFVKVDKNFGSIFGELLPGASAKLVKVDPKSILCGVEVSVAFGDVWKDSLSELSGGQRSLLALSLILSLLLFKPAPMYILDEIDAALDLSHTQNIGRMLSSHFARSQFVVVSLKEGMFSNANVLFRVKFVNGVSAVTRVSCRKGSKRYLKKSGA